MILNAINSPDDLKQLSPNQLKTLADELRHYIITTLASHPGHLASSLGTVELTVALLYVFNMPDDKLIWDVGHQAYGYKILTGRREQFPSIRTYGGLSGFPRMDESPYDAFGTGHSSTSISAALGMATASRLQGNLTRQHIAVIGDGAMTGGEAFEALNNAGISKSNILVILNDNGISIDRSVGGLSKYLTVIAASPQYNQLKERMWRHTGGDQHTSRARQLLSHAVYMAKRSMMKQSNLFESFGFRYFGPIDGHDMAGLVKILNDLKGIKGPRLLHIVTKKGKGLNEAEKNPTTYHAPGEFNAKTGKQIQAPSQPKPLKYQEVFGHTIIELARNNPRIVGITPAMPTGCSLNMMMEVMPDRVFDVGIAEQHAVTFAAGLAAQGLLPFCNIYSSFAQRAYDQVIHDVALQRLPVVLCLDRAGLVGADGPTHHGVFDMAYLRPIPNLTIASPMDDHELRNLMYTAQLDGQGAFVIRYPRGSSVHIDWHSPMQQIPVGTGRTLLEGSEGGVALLSIGPIGNAALSVAQRLHEAEGLSVGVFDMRFLKPLDTTLLNHIMAYYTHIVTLEDGVKAGGFGSAVLEYVEAHRVGEAPRVTIIGIPDEFISHGATIRLRQYCHIDDDAILQTVRSICHQDMR